MGIGGRANDGILLTQIIAWCIDVAKPLQNKPFVPMKLLLFLPMLVLLAVPAAGQRPGAPDSVAASELDYLRRHEIRHAQILTAWGLGHLLIGGTSMFLTAIPTEAHQFHHMNAAWGSINLPIGLWMWHNARQFSPQNTPNPLGKARAFRRLLLVNVGLDVAYVGAGLWLAHHGRQPGPWDYLYRGFGNACIVQGAGMFTLDLTSSLLLIRHQRRAGR